MATKTCCQASLCLADHCQQNKSCHDRKPFNASGLQKHCVGILSLRVFLRRYADFAGGKINEAFDYTHGNDLWKEKLDYTNSWLSAHISDANAVGKPLIVEEFGKAKAASKVYTGEFPHGIVPGQHMCTSLARCRTMPCTHVLRLCRGGYMP